MTGKTEHENLVVQALQNIETALEAKATESDVAFTETITFNGVGLYASYEDFGEGWSETIKAPSGYKGKVLGVNIYGVTETFNAVTTGARVDVGTSADQDAYATTASIGAASAAAPVHPAVTHNAWIPGGADFVVTGVAPTGGTPAGRSRAGVTIAWVKETA